jgi:hypothetical protein
VGTGLRRLLPRRLAPPPRAGADPSPDGYADEAELREFLAADEAPEEADPRFREELRRRLWTWLRARWSGTARASDDASHGR